jgi:hypothetical protein
MSKSANKDPKKYKSNTSCWGCDNYDGRKCSCGPRSRAASKRRFESEVDEDLTAEDPPDEMCFDSGVKKKSKSKKFCPDGTKHEVVWRIQVRKLYMTRFKTGFIVCKKCKQRLKRVWKPYLMLKNPQDVLDGKYK